MAIRLPVYDSPTTRDLLDQRSGIYWGLDAFAAPVPGRPGSHRSQDNEHDEPELLDRPQHQPIPVLD